MTSHTGDTDNKRSNKTGMKRRKISGSLESNLPPRSQEEEEVEEDGEEEGGLVQEKEKKEEAAVRRFKRERRQGGNSVTMCQVCNMKLNSGAQAQIHYRGKTHQRRLRHLNKATVTGSLSQGPARPLLASLSVPGGRRLQPQTTPPHLELKHFLPLRVNGSSPLSLFPNFNMMDPVQKAVINHTFGVSPPKKKPIISCNICHLRFNSTTQAEAHYKGHKHARKLRALDTQRRRQRNGHSPSSAGKDRERERAPPTDTPHLEDVTGLSSTPDPAQIRVEDIQGTSSAPAPVSQSSAVDATTVLSPTLSVVEKESPDCQLSDPKSDGEPVEGPAHGPAPTSDPKDPVPGGPEEVAEEGEEAKKSSAKQRLHCPVCKVTVNSSSQLEAHYSGSRHKQMLEGQNGSQSRRRSKLTSSPRPAHRTKQPMANKSRAAGAGTSSQPFHCELCQLSVNSETQLKQHMNSRRHKERLAGKPAKPKFSPFNKVQPSTMLATKLALQKHLSKLLPAGFLASGLNPATLCTMASGPLALRIPPGFFQGPLLSPTLFRPAPGPLRATHAPIIFSPY